MDFTLLVNHRREFCRGVHSHDHSAHQKHATRSGIRPDLLKMVERVLTFSTAQPRPKLWTFAGVELVRIPVLGG